MKTAIIRIPLTALRCNPQVRKEFDPESLSDLATSLLEVGQLYPIRVRPDDDCYRIEDGERRFRAAQLAKLTALDAIVVEGGISEAERIAMQLVSNCQRAALTPLETARAVDELIEVTNWTESEVAKRLGFSVAKVSRLLTLLTLPTDLLAQVESGAIPGSAGYELAKIQNPAERAQLAAEVASGRLTRDGVAARSKRMRRASATDESAPPQRVTAALSGGRSITFAGPGLSNVDALISWLGELASEARRVKAQNLELATFARMLRDRSKA